MPITIAPCGAELTVRRVGTETQVKKRLHEMGIVEGGKITVISSDSGSVVVSVKECRLCLDGNTARKILVA